MYTLTLLVLFTYCTLEIVVLTYINHVSRQFFKKNHLFTAMDGYPPFSVVKLVSKMTCKYCKVLHY